MALDQETWERFNSEEQELRSEGRRLERLKNDTGAEWATARREGEHYRSGTPQRERFERAKVAFEEAIALNKEHRKKWQSFERRYKNASRRWL